MALNKSQLNKLSKEDLVTTSLQEERENSLNLIKSQMDNNKEEISNLRDLINKVLETNDLLKSDISALKTANGHLEQRIIKSERELLWLPICSNIQRRHFHIQ